MKRPVTIACAAILDHDGSVYTVPPPGRHHHVIRIMAERGCPTPITGKQGFVTNEGLFVDRTQAWEIAEAAGQIRDRDGRSRDGYLFSEDLW